jgi:hypothetical protein
MIDIAKCREALVALMKGEGKITMPEMEQDDSDVLLSRALDELEGLQKMDKAVKRNAVS